jgi:hypothetical protein
MKSSIIEKILNDVSLDARIQDGIFSLEENSHMDVLREYLVKKGIDEEAVREYTNLVLDGKYPERQAYNQNGILVTFPTPEYKQRAIQRGTHFEKDPTKGKPNLFPGQAAPDGGEQAPQSSPQQPAQAGAQPKTNLPLSQAGGAPIPQPDTPDKSQPEAPPATVAAPQQAATPQAPPMVEPSEPTPPPPPPSPEEKEANKAAIKKMLKGDDYMLEQVVHFLMVANEGYGNSWALSSLMENIKKKL